MWVMLKRVLGKMVEVTTSVKPLKTKEQEVNRTINKTVGLVSRSSTTINTQLHLLE
jgi:hypothetical protein